MKDITVLIPLHDISVQYIEMLQNAVNNVNSMVYDGNICINVIIPKQFDFPTIKSERPIKFISNPGKTDYCSQINYGVSQVETEYFSILEVDDRYDVKWFKMFDEYYNTNEDVSVFLPINVIHDVRTNYREFMNHIAWSTGFTVSDDNPDMSAMEMIGYVTFASIQNTSTFNLTGAIFKTSDWIGYKPSIKIAFNYEYLLRLTNPKSKSHKPGKVFVIPKEAYYHEIFREGSLIEQYDKEIKENDIAKWFELAKREYTYDEDRNNDIISGETTNLK